MVAPLVPLSARLRIGNSFILTTANRLRYLLNVSTVRMTQLEGVGARNDRKMIESFCCRPTGYYNMSYHYGMTTEAIV